MTDRPDVADALWDFALRVYGGDDVSTCCLTLQDSFGADVPVLLTALWMARRGAVLDASGMALVEARIGAWRSETVQPLRALRRRLKSGALVAGFDGTEALRSEVKRAELHAEKIQLAALAFWVDQTFPATGQGAVRDNLAAALAHYSGGADIPERLIAPLVTAAEAA
ncbi:TIGR02444 family protein [Roseivivax sp. CAU 1753]